MTTPAEAPDGNLSDLIIHKSFTFYSEIIFVVGNSLHNFKYLLETLNTLCLSYDNIVIN
jgi:hypothetical protein